MNRGVAPRPYKRPESVLVVVYTQDGDVLLLKRADHPEFWQSVTGSLHWDETPPATARRELREETGIEAMGLTDHQQTCTFAILPRWRGRFAPGTQQNLEHLFSLCLPNRVEIQLNPGEHTEFAWLRKTAAVKKVWSWTNRDAIQQVVS